MNPEPKHNGGGETVNEYTSGGWELIAVICLIYEILEEQHFSFLSFILLHLSDGILCASVWAPVLQISAMPCINLKVCAVCRKWRRAQSTQRGDLIQSFSPSLMVETCVLFLKFKDSGRCCNCTWNIIVSIYNVGPQPMPLEPNAAQYKIKYICLNMKSSSFRYIGGSSWDVRITREWRGWQIKILMRLRGFLALFYREGSVATVTQVQTI